MIPCARDGVQWAMPETTLPPFYDSLALTLARCWDLLVAGATDRRVAFHTPAVATIGRTGAPEVRTVVLRAADPERRALRFHTDLRSGKVAELQREPRIALHFYDPGEKVQLRVTGVARLHGPGSQLAAVAWQQSQDLSRKCYGQYAAPGTPVADPAGALVGTDDAEIGRPHFVAVEVMVLRIEWLYLAHQGHRRAAFTWREGDGPVPAEQTWLAP